VSETSVFSGFIETLTSGVDAQALAKSMHTLTSRCTMFSLCMYASAESIGKMTSRTARLWV
jgi:hypothetical protein